jgi:hypothetical protein
MTLSQYSKTQFIDNADNDERLVKISPYLVVRVQRDHSLYVYRHNGIDHCIFSLSIKDIERLVVESRRGV